MLLKVKTMSHIVSFFSLLPHHNHHYRCSTPSLLWHFAKKGRPAGPSCPFFKNYNLHCFFLTTCKMSRRKAAGERTGLPATEGEKESACRPHLRRQLDTHLSHHPAPCCTLPSTRRLDHVFFPLKTSRNPPFPWLSLDKDSRPCWTR